MAALLIVLRFAHIFFACVAVGGLAFQRFALVPTLAQLQKDEKLDGNTKLEFQQVIRARWSRWVMAAIGFLLISGLINFVFTLKLFADPYATVSPVYHALFGIKFLAALAVFLIVSILSGKRDKTARFRENPTPWLNLCLVLVMVILGISAYLRSTHLQPPLASVVDTTVANSTK